MPSEIEYINNYDPSNDLGLLKTNIPVFWRLNILNRLIDRGFVSNDEAKLAQEGIVIQIEDQKEGDK